MNLILMDIDNRSMMTSKSGLSNIQKEQHAQYFTPLDVADYMASMFDDNKKKTIKILDPGAGVGNLTLSLVNSISKWEKKPSKILVDLYEVDEVLVPLLKENLLECEAICKDNKIKFHPNIIVEDFIASVVSKQNETEVYDQIILNPPYKKLSSTSKHDGLLKSVGINVPNYYAAFVSLSKRLLNKKGEMVAIIPRSFCNGQYFTEFRIDLCNTLKLENIHLFEKREGIFYDDVLQETVILKYRNSDQKEKDSIRISTSLDNDFSKSNIEEKLFNEIVFPTDKRKVIRISSNENEIIQKKMSKITNSLNDIGLSVSTGPIVDFRNREALRTEPAEDTYPLLYAHNIKDFKIDFPSKSHKPSYILSTEKCRNALRMSELYVLVNRMSSKEEPKRIKAAVFDGTKFTGDKVGLDNKLNFFHMSGRGISQQEIARGLWIYLNSDLVDFYFRTFSGSTQVNATDLKETLKYPTINQLIGLGKEYDKEINKEKTFDELLELVIFTEG